MKWWLWLIVIYCIICFLMFVSGKLKDPMNPAGYMMPKIEQVLEELKIKNILV